MLNPKLVDMQSTGYGLVGRELRSLVADTFEVILPQAPLRGGGVAPVLSFGPLLNRWPSASRRCSAARSTARTPTIGPCGARTPAQPTGPRLLEPFPECSLGPPSRPPPALPGRYAAASSGPRRPAPDDIDGLLFPESEESPGGGGGASFLDGFAKFVKGFQAM